MTIRFRGGLVLATIASALVFAACGDDNGSGPDPIPPGAAELNADIIANRTLHAETTYTLTAYVHVQPPAVLTIEPGTTIKGRTGSALFVMRGARINAEGRADAPIVFTSDQAVGSRKPGDWGGLVLVGNGIINRTGTIFLEGTGTTGNPQVQYSGGTDNADNSGVLRYVRVEFGGFGVANDQELNSVTFAAVGSGTQVDHVQTLAGLDDAFEWFGGAVDAKYLVSYETADDHFDAAEGYVGRVQHLIAFQSTVLPPRAGSGILSSDPQGFEVDGCGSVTTTGCPQGNLSTPLTIPLFANFTLIGTGPNDAVNATSGGVGMVLRRGAGGYYMNGLIARWPRAALSFRDPETQTRLTAGDLVTKNISVVEIGTTAGTNGPVLEGGTGRLTIDLGANAIVAEPGTVTTAATFTSIPATTVVPTVATLDFSLAATAAARTGGSGAFTGVVATKGGTVVTGTTYRGAWAPDGSAGAKWWQGWTNYARQ